MYGQIHILGERINSSNTLHPNSIRHVYQNGAITKVAPATPPKVFNQIKSAQSEDDQGDCLMRTLRPIHNLLRLYGIFPIKLDSFQVTTQWMVYSVFLFAVVVGYIVYLHWDSVEVSRSAEGKFEEVVIDYLFSVYLLPIVINPIVWYQSRHQARVLSQLQDFENFYNRITHKPLMLFLGNKPLMVSVMLPLISCGTMVITHLTMVNFRLLQVIPYCYINTVTYIVGGAWYVYCDVIGKVATVISEDFQLALRHIGPAARVAHYRSLWMMLSKIIRDVGNSFAYAVTFLCLYLFLIITLTIYGLLSQLQGGFGTKDIGLTITAAFAIALLFFVCDEAHYASSCVRTNFQKKLLLVELTWMNDDAQQEINMFLKATEMNPTNMTLSGFFDVNRNLFKSLLATMVTYLVVLLQFQISIPEDTSSDIRPNATNTAVKSP